MNLVLTEDAGSVRLVCGPVLQVREVADLWRILQPILAAPPETLVMDATAVERVDTAVLQAFAVLMRDLRIAGTEVQWEGASEVWAAAADLLGTSELMQGMS